MLANVEVDGESLSDDELVMFLNQLLVAGNETTRNMVSGGMCGARRSTPSSGSDSSPTGRSSTSAIEEILRWTTPVISFMRTATRRHRGPRRARSRAGDPLLLLYASANRDEDEFGPTADEFDVGRDPNHARRVRIRCRTSASVPRSARLEIAAMLDALLDRFTDGRARGRGRAHGVVDHRGRPRRAVAVQLSTRVRRCGSASVSTPRPMRMPPSAYRVST